MPAATILSATSGFMRLWTGRSRSLLIAWSAGLHITLDDGRAGWCSLLSRFHPLAARPAGWRVNHRLPPSPPHRLGEAASSWANSSSVSVTAAPRHFPRDGQTGRCPGSQHHRAALEYQASAIWPGVAPFALASISTTPPGLARSPAASGNPGRKPIAFASQCSSTSSSTRFPRKLRGHLGQPGDGRAGLGRPSGGRTTKIEHEAVLPVCFTVLAYRST